MPESAPTHRKDFSAKLEAYAPRWLVALGLKSWLMAGFIAVLGVVIALIGVASGLITPLILAVVIGMLFYPLVDRIRR